MSDRDRAQQWLAGVIGDWLDDRDTHLARPLAATILDTPGVEVEEQWGTRHLDIETGKWETFACADRAAASANFDYLNEVWGHHAELIHRSVITTPWSPVEPVKEEK